MTIALFSEEVKDRSLRSLANYEGQGVDEACEAINSATKGLGVSIVVVRDLSYSSCPRVIRTALVDSKLTLGMAITLPLRSGCRYCAVHCGAPREVLTKPVAKSR